MRRETKSFLFSLLKELTVLKTVFFLFMVLLVGNLSALVDAVLHPEIPYFDEEHLIIGGAYALLLTVMFLTLALYITKLKMASKTQSESEEKFRVLAEKSPNMIFINKRGQVIYANEKCSELMGYTRDEFLSPGFDFLTLIAPESLELVKNAYSQHMKGKDLPPFEYVLLTRDGRRIAVILTSKLIDIGGETAILGIITDITERKRAEEEVRRAKEEWERTFDAITAPIMILDVNHRIVKVNKILAEKLGITATEAQGLTCYKAVHGRQEPHPDCPHSKLLADGQVHSAEIYEERLGGYFMITVSPIYDSEGRLIGSIHAGLDITDRKKMEKELRILNENLEMKVEEKTGQLMKAQEELARKERLTMLGQLAGSVGHELRNPLGVISNAVYFLKTVITDASETVKEYLNIIKDEVDNSQHIISDLLDLSRTNTPQPRAISVQELIRLSLAKCVIPENVAMQLDLPETLPDVLTDPRQMEQVFQNLITNALQAMPEGGTLSIAARRVGSQESGVGGSEAREKYSEPRTKNSELDRDFVEISVTDTGKGISPENIEMLFQPLFTTKARGIGLGLAISRRFAEANNGKLEVESREGKGAAFIVTLPAAGKGQLEVSKK